MIWRHERYLYEKYCTFIVINYHQNIIRNYPKENFTNSPEETATSPLSLPPVWPPIFQQVSYKIESSCYLCGKSSSKNTLLPDVINRMFMINKFTFGSYMKLFSYLFLPWIMSRMFVDANKWSKWWPTLSDCRAEQTGRHRAGNRFLISSSVLSISLFNIQNIHLASQFRTCLLFNFFVISDSAFISFSPQDMVHHTHAPSTLTKYGHLVKRLDNKVVIISQTHRCFTTNTAFSAYTSVNCFHCLHYINTVYTVAYMSRCVATC